MRWLLLTVGLSLSLVTCGPTILDFLDGLGCVVIPVGIWCMLFSLLSLGFFTWHASLYVGLRMSLGKGPELR